MIDITKPIVAVDGYKSEKTYIYVGQYVPADGSEPILHVQRTEKDDGYGNVAEIYASTGKVVRGMAGSGLIWKNAAEIVTKWLWLSTSQFMVPPTEPRDFSGKTSAWHNQGPSPAAWIEAGSRWYECKINVETGDIISMVELIKNGDGNIVER